MKNKTLMFIILFLFISSSLTIALITQNIMNTPSEKAENSEYTMISFTLINADTDQPLETFDPFKNATTLNLTSLPTRNLNIRANTEPANVGSVLFRLDDNLKFNIENLQPYALAGDSPPGDYNAWTPSPGWHTLTATPYTDPVGNGTAGTSLTIIFNVIEEPVRETGPLPGQIIVDPQHPEWLKYCQGGPFFMCGPGDPEDFLYRGRRNADGTRDGDQMDLIDKLKPTGANCIYLQAVRSHGGDGESTHNPFVDNDPAKGLDQDILDQWETWFTEMDDNGITIFFFFYDDGAVVWDTGDIVGSEERSFIHALVDRYKHHKHLIWVVAEEYGHAYNATRISNIAAEIRSADDHQHPIAVHHPSHLSMAFPDDPNIDQYAMQFYSVYDREELHNIIVHAWKEAEGLYNLNMAEADRWGTSATARKKNWACAMGGAYIMILRMDIENTSIRDLEDCGRLVRFMESTNFNEMAPHDELAYGGTEYLLALPGDSYIAYASALSGDIGLRNTTEGFYDFKWYDVTNGSTVIQKGVKVYSGDQTWRKPAGIGNELAVYVKRIDDETIRMRVFPGTRWETKSPAELGMDAAKLDEIEAALGGRGCIIKDGYVVKTWGSQTEPSDWASSSKPVISTLLLFAVKEGKLKSVDALVKDWEWELIPKDQNMTFRHLANMVSGYARPEKPGEAYAYNDRAIQLYYMTVERVFQQSLNDAAMPRLHSPLQLEGSVVFNSNRRVFLSVQDFARICWFWLNKGNWDGHQLLPKSYFEDYMKPGVPKDLPYAPFDHYIDDYLNIGTYGAEVTSRESGPGPGIYGFNWWFNAPGRLRDGTYFNLSWPDAPPDTIMTIGYGGHNSIIIPSLDIVLVSAKGDWGTPRITVPGIMRSRHNDVMKLLVESLSG